MSQAPVHKYIDELIGLVESGSVVPLSKVTEAYDMFKKKADNCVKVILKP